MEDGHPQPPSGETAVSVRHVYKIFGGNEEGALARAMTGTTKEAIQEQHDAVLALSDVTFDVKRGELFVVMGLSGCGKSTLVRCINRLIAPSAGEIWLGDREITAMDEEELRELRRSEVAMVFQHYGLLPHRSVLDNVAWGLEVNGVEKRRRYQRADEALTAVGLDGWGDRMTDQLSGGMKQRVGLARALAQDAPVLLMDEPFSALDPVIRRELQDELAKLQAELHKTIIFITHDLSEAVRIGDRIAIMARRRRRAAGRAVGGGAVAGERFRAGLHQGGAAAVDGDGGLGDAGADQHGARRPDALGGARDAGGGGPQPRRGRSTATAVAWGA